MVKGRGQKASEQPRNINAAFSELRGLVRDGPLSLNAPALRRAVELVHAFEPNEHVLLDYIYEFLADTRVGRDPRKTQNYACQRGADA